MEKSFTKAFFRGSLKIKTFANNVYEIIARSSLCFIY